jgi:hypothetical protein
MSDESPIDFFNDNAGTMALLGSAAVNRNISATNEKLRELQRTIEEAQRANEHKLQTAAEKKEVLFLFIKRFKEIVTRPYINKTVKFLLLERFQLFFNEKGGLKTADFNDISDKERLSELQNEMSNQKKLAFSKLGQDDKELIKTYVDYDNVNKVLDEFIEVEKQLKTEKWRLDNFKFPSKTNLLDKISKTKLVAATLVFLLLLVSSISLILNGGWGLCLAFWFLIVMVVIVVLIPMPKGNDNITEEYGILRSQVDSLSKKKRLFLDAIKTNTLIEKSAADFFANEQNSLEDKEQLAQEHYAYRHKLAEILGLVGSFHAEYVLDTQLIGLEVTEYFIKKTIYLSESNPSRANTSALNQLVEQQKKTNGNLKWIRIGLGLLALGIILKLMAAGNW